MHEVKSESEVAQSGLHARGEGVTEDSSQEKENATGEELKGRHSRPLWLE